MGTSTCLLLTPPKPPSTSSIIITQNHHHHHSQFQKFRINQIPPFSISIMNPNSSPQTRISAALKSNPKGFGSPPPRKSKKKSKKEEFSNPDDDNDEEDEEEDEISGGEGIIPEVVTNRMMKRVAFTVGTPLFTGLLFFPFFYYLKVGLKIDVPTWIPFIVSFIFFGSALVGVSYGIVSSSWDPLREGSLLGWNEAKKNWPVFWQSFRGGAKSTK